MLLYTVLFAYLNIRLLIYLLIPPSACRIERNIDEHACLYISVRLFSCSSLKLSVYAPWIYLSSPSVWFLSHLPQLIRTWYVVPKFFNSIVQTKRLTNQVSIVSCFHCNICFICVSCRDESVLLRWRIYGRDLGDGISALCRGVNVL